MTVSEPLCFKVFCQVKAGKNYAHSGRSGGRRVSSKLHFFLLLYLRLCRFCILLQCECCDVKEMFQITFPFINVMLLILS